jgi:hypothetical protein
LSGQITLLLEDYRDLKGRYDKLVSIEMIEAIGHQYLDTYFAKVGSLLEDHGAALIQAITIEDHRYERALTDIDFIKRYIFPGSFIPRAAMLGCCAHRPQPFHLEDIGPSCDTCAAGAPLHAGSPGPNPYQAFRAHVEVLPVLLRGRFSRTLDRTCSCCWRGGPVAQYLPASRMPVPGCCWACGWDRGRRPAVRWIGWARAAMACGSTGAGAADICWSAWRHFGFASTAFVRERTMPSGRFSRAPV